MGNGNSEIKSAGDVLKFTPPVLIANEIQKTTQPTKPKPTKPNTEIKPPKIDKPKSKPLSTNIFGDIPIIGGVVKSNNDGLKIIRDPIKTGIGATTLQIDKTKNKAEQNLGLLTDTATTLNQTGNAVVRGASAATIQTVKTTTNTVRTVDNGLQTVNTGLGAVAGVGSTGLNVAGNAFEKTANTVSIFDNITNIAVVAGIGIGGYALYKGSQKTA